MLAHPVQLIDSAADTVRRLADAHRLALITKGDFFHQESKIARSGLADLFTTIEIVPEDPAAALSVHWVGFRRRSAAALAHMTAELQERSPVMRVACTGSIANDYLMTFPGRFHEQLVGDQLERLSLSFLVDSLEVRRGGVAANIAFGMGLLGHRPILVGAVGHDFPADYEDWLRDHNVDLESLRVSADLHTCRFLCTNDQAESQIASFYPGAMEEARHIDLATVASRVGGLDLVVVSPNDPLAMRRHTTEAHTLGIAVLADPSQQIALLSGEEIRPLIDGATYLIGNDYERSLIARKTGWSHDEVLDRVDICVTTHGPKGCQIDRAGQERIEVDAVQVRDDVELEPTGAGDAFRAGFLSGLAWGLTLERCAQVGALLGVMALESVGPQEYAVDPAGAHARLTRAYGDEAADEIVAVLPD